jgi:hypothetical protein
MWKLTYGTYGVPGKMIYKWWEKPHLIEFTAGCWLRWEDFPEVVHFLEDQL